MACFSDINVSQGGDRGVATYARCGVIFNIHSTTILPKNLPVEKNYSRLRFDKSCGHESAVPLFWTHPV